MKGTKIEAYVGFAIRARRLVVGVNAICSIEKGVFCILIDRSIAKNSRKQMENYSKKIACPLIETENLGWLVRRENAKAAAVTEPSLAQAIVKEAELFNKTEGVNV